jgi:hypothetical protein
MTITTNGATTPTREMYTHAAKCYAEKTNNKDHLRRSRSRDGEETTNKQSLVSKCLFDEIDGTFLQVRPHSSAHIISKRPTTANSNGHGTNSILDLLL